MPSAFIAASFAANRAANDELASRRLPAICNLFISEDAPHEAIAVALDSVPDAFYLGGVDARAYNFHPRRSYMTLPTVPDSFFWADTTSGAILKCRPLDAVARHLFTTRDLQLSSAAAWGQVGEALGGVQVATLNQVHGRDVVSIRRDSPHSIGTVRRCARVR